MGASKWVVGSLVRRRGSGRVGEIVRVTDREVVVRYAATGVVRLSPWGEYRDAGETGHHMLRYADRMLEVLS